MLTPTTIYSPIIQKLLDQIPILGMAHITGGGIPENLPRCLPEGLTANVDYWSWDRPELFTKIEMAGDIEEKEMRRVFNLGIGFCLIVSPEVANDALWITALNCGMKSWIIGEVNETTSS